jgi:hypothetical protein
MPEPSTSRATPAAAASCASVLAPCSCTDSKVTPGFLDIGGDDVDDGVDPGYGGGDGALVAHVGAEDRDTVQINRSEDAPRPIGRPNRNAQRRSFGGEPPHESPAEEARAAEHADRGHGIAFSMAEKTGICVRRAVERGGDANTCRRYTALAYRRKRDLCDYTK